MARDTQYPPRRQCILYRHDAGRWISAFAGMTFFRGNDATNAETVIPRSLSPRRRGAGMHRLESWNGRTKEQAPRAVSPLLASSEHQCTHLRC